MESVGFGGRAGLVAEDDDVFGVDVEVDLVGGAECFAGSWVEFDGFDGVVGEGEAVLGEGAEVDLAFPVGGEGVVVLAGLVEELDGFGADGAGDGSALGQVIGEDGRPDFAKGGGEDDVVALGAFDFCGEEVGFA